MSNTAGPACVALAAIGAVTSVHAQPQDQPAEARTKTVEMVRTDTPPTIDGDLGDAVWADAAVVDDLHQVNPVEYAEPFQRTEIRLLYDDENLYVGARLYDTDPEEITANIMRQGGDITGDDNLFVTLDPANNQRSGYFFGVNPHGVRQDGLYRNVSEFYADWDGIYEVETGRFENGWTAEFRIPTRTLSFEPGGDAWGLNFSRTVQRKNEDMAWVSRNRSWDPSSSGRAVGFEGLEQGLGLDVVPSAAWTQVRSFAPGSEELDLDPSLDVAYKLTSQLNALLTINTDFSATEVDDRQVNLTRFNLFFPERRDFFLSDADIFEFGRIGAQSSNGSVSGADQQTGRPFFSRRIGLSSTGEVVGLDYGGKISGRIGPWQIGTLSIRQEAQPGPGVSADNLSVIRAKSNVLDESSAGFILTEGDPQSDLDNSLAGFDFLYRNTRLSGDRTLEAQAWVQRTETEGLEGDDGALGLGFSVPSSTGMRGGVTVREFEDNFNPALGFMNRTGIRDYSGHAGYTLRPDGGNWQQAYFGVEFQRIEDIDGRLESQAVGVTPVELTSRTGDVIFVHSNIRKEVLREPFEISPGVVIPSGSYSYSDIGFEYRWAGFREWSGRLTYIKGDFYTGEEDRWFGGVTWQPSPHFRGGLNFNLRYVDLPQGEFTARVVSADLDFVFSPELSWVNRLQYDNFSETIGLNSRLRWIPEAGREIYFVINHSVEDLDRDNTFESRRADMTAKVSYTFRF